MQKGVEIMALPDTLPAFTPDEYLAFERSSENKHEYFDGLIYAMAGSSPAHSTICVNVSEVITKFLNKRIYTFYDYGPPRYTQR